MGSSGGSLGVRRGGVLLRGLGVLLRGCVRSRSRGFGLICRLTDISCFFFFYLRVGLQIAASLFRRHDKEKADEGERRCESGDNAE